MKKDRAIQLADGPGNLARLLEITPSAVSQWGEELPAPRVWQLRVLRPQWFVDTPAAQLSQASAAAETQGAA